MALVISHVGRGATAYFLIRGLLPALPAPPGDAPTDSDGVVLVDENGDVLIWG